MSKDLNWKLESEHELLKTCVFTVNETTSVSPRGEKGHYIVTDAPDWVIIIPEINENFLMVKQWRHGENALSIEFPGGVINKGEEPVIAAKRELEEETGYNAEKIIFLGKANPNPALMKNKVYFFAAKNLKKSGGQHLDDDEFVEFMEIPKIEVYKKIGTEEYSHALMMSALLKYKLFEENELISKNCSF